jgi:S-adenosylmethionine decarboxylase
VRPLFFSGGQQGSEATGSFMKNLAPTIHRQRQVIEGYPRSPISARQIRDYLSKLSDLLKMKTLLRPVTHRSDKFGWAGWIHWESSGAHFYAWDQPVLFFSVDIYTCKKFDPKKAACFTKQYFHAKEVRHKSV